MSLSLLQDRLASRAYHASPFFVLGDPDPETSIELAVDAVAAGASMLELGIPYRDACADGPAVDAAFGRALAAGCTTGVARDVLAEIRSRCPDTPLNLLVYGNLVHAAGEERFCRDWSAVGASSLLVPDIPMECSAGLRDACAKHGLGHVVLVGPRTPEVRVQRLAGYATGFVYAAATQGVTGSSGQTESALTAVARARVTGRPVCAGFGIATPEALAGVFAAGAQIGIVGSHLLRVIAAGGADRAAVRRGVRDAWRPFPKVAMGEPGEIPVVSPL